MCEATFLSGSAGSGKSTLLRTLIRACDDERWFVLSCKFDKRSSPHVVLAAAFDEFFGKCDLSEPSSSADARSSSPLSEAHRRACRRIFMALDDFSSLLGLTKAGQAESLEVVAVAFLGGGKPTSAAATACATTREAKLAAGGRGNYDRGSTAADG